MTLRLRIVLGTLAVLVLAAIALVVNPCGQGDLRDGALPGSASEHGHQSPDEIAAPQLVGRGGVVTAATVPSEEAPPVRGLTPWTATATVRSRDFGDHGGWRRPAGGELLAGATVRLWLISSGMTELIAEGTTDTTGRVALDLQVVTSRSRNRLAQDSVVGHVEAPGHYEWRGMPKWVGHFLDEKLEPISWSMEFTLGASPVVRGQVVCDGEPLRFAAVSLAPADGKSQRGGFAFTDPDGRYAITVPGPGKFQVWSRRRDVEVGSTGVFSSDGVHDATAPLLRLHRLPEKRGAVRYEDGTPVSDLTFEIDHPSFDIHYDPWVPSLGHVRVRTDDRGEFRVVLPRVNDMNGRLKGGFTVEIPGVEAEKTGFDPAASTLLLTLPAHRLRTRLADDRGSPLPGKEVSFFRQGKRWAAARGATDENGEVSLFLEPGVFGHLFLVGAGHAPVTMAVEVPETGNESVITLDVPDRELAGSLAFLMRTPAGEPVFPVEVDVETPEGFDIVEESFKSDDDRVVLPPGAYSVRLWSSKEHPTWKEEVPDIRSVVKLDENVVVRSGETTTIEVEWMPTAALAVKLLVPEGVKGDLEGSRAFLEAAGAERQQVSMAPKYGRGYGPLRANAWLFTTWLQDPGSYLLTIEAEGFRTISRDVKLVADEVTWVEMVMEREP